MKQLTKLIDAIKNVGNSREYKRKELTKTCNLGKNTISIYKVGTREPNIPYGIVRAPEVPKNTKSVKRRVKNEREK